MNRAEPRVPTARHAVPQNAIPAGITPRTPWIDYRASLARIADERPWALVCPGCGCELDYGPPAHSPRCSRTPA